MLTKNESFEPTYTKADIFAHIEKMVQDSAFFSSNILKRFLLFIVNETLEGRSNCLKEYTIAVKVLEKPPDFKPQQNGIVRIHAGRLRRAISHYYAQNGASERLRISIPKGNYVPVFEYNNEPGRHVTPGEFKSASFGSATSSRKIRVGVLPFRHCSTQKMAISLADGIGFQLTAGLQNVNNVSVIAFQLIKSLLENSVDLCDLNNKIGTQFFFTGGIETSKNRIRVSMELIKTGSFEQVWSDFFEKQISQSNLFDLQDEITESALFNLQKWFNHESGNLSKIALMRVSRNNRAVAQLNP